MRAARRQLLHCARASSTCGRGTASVLWSAAPARTAFSRPSPRHDPQTIRAEKHAEGRVRHHAQAFAHAGAETGIDKRAEIGLLRILGDDDGLPTEMFQREDR